MSVIIIGGGRENRTAIEELEQASLTWTESQRAEAEAMLRAHAHRIRDFVRQQQTQVP